VDDYPEVNASCEPVRESLSALMDREWPTLTKDEVMGHLAGCPDCRRWQDRAVRATRVARTTVPGPPPRLNETLVAALAGRRWSRWTLPVRILLGLVGWGIAAYAVPALVYGLDAEAPPHVAHEMGSLNVAMGLALVLVAFRPKHAGAVTPLFAVVVGLLLFTAGDDLFSGHTTPLREAPHALVAVGLVLLVALNRLGRASSTTRPPDRTLLPTPTELRGRGRSTGPGAAPRKRAM
jgi:predicted anti-sigma-YlaC factor YlaD